MAPQVPHSVSSLPAAAGALALRAHGFTALTIHASENEAENRDVLERFGRTPVQLLADVGLFDAGLHVTLGHGVRLDAQDQALAKNLALLESEHREASTHVDKTLLARYNQIKSAKKEQALAAVREGMCAGCRLQIPPQLVAQVKRSEDLQLCPYCRRILYWEGDAPVETSSALSEAKKSDMEVGESV